MMAAKPGESPGGVKGQLELFREYALGQLPRPADCRRQGSGDAGVARRTAEHQPAAAAGELRARDHGAVHVRRRRTSRKRTCTRRRECSPAGTCGSAGASDDPNRQLRVLLHRARTSTTSDAKTFTFDDLPERRPHHSGARGDRAGRHRLHQRDRRHPADRSAARAQALRVTSSARRRRRRPASSTRVANVYYGSGYDMRAVVRAILLSPEFHDEASHFARYSWPASSWSARSRRRAGSGFSVDSALSPLINMGQQLFEPPDVNGWELGEGWFSTSGMLSRMNFAATLTTNQRVNLRNAARPFAQDAAERAVVRHGSPVADAVRDGAVQRAARVSARRHQLDRLGHRAAGEGGRADPSGARLGLPDGERLQATVLAAGPSLRSP